MENQKKPFREFHILQILDGYEKQTMPLDVFLYFYGKKHKSLGSHDRREISDTVYDLIRWRGLLDHLAASPILSAPSLTSSTSSAYAGPSSSSIASTPLNWEKRLAVYKNISLDRWIKDPHIPLHVRLSFPKKYFTKIFEAYGEEKTQELCLTLNEKAPLTIRCNTGKISRDDLLQKLSALDMDVKPCEHSKVGIQFQKKIACFSLPEFQQGFFEVQDEGSQLIASLIQAKPKDHVFDFCAGSGGKSLAIAPLLQNRGVLYLHDVRPFILQQAKKRCKRAGITNVQFIFPEDLEKKNLIGRMDWVFTDVPCSGSGTLRRNPDMKWKWSEEDFYEIISLQRSIVEKAIPYLKPEGKLVYATCSLFPEENEKQVEFFLQNHPLELEGEVVKYLPQKGGMDGFFGAVFRRKRS
jgi:16S rRNA (cytosine(967)-C(5))-methyltransferase